MNNDAPYRSLYAYPWDLAETDGDAFAAFLCRQGLNGVTLAAAYHAGKFLRPHGRRGRVHFPEDGAAYFRARPDRYGRIRPFTAEMTGTDDVLGRLTRRGDFRVEAWLVLLHNTPLGRRHPEAVARNAFGDPYWYSLCPANPDVADYAVQLCCDVAGGYDVAGLVIETPGWLPYRHGYHHEAMFLESNPALEAGLALCFCDHCMAGGAAEGIAMVALRERVMARVDRMLAATQEVPAAVGSAWLAHDLALDADLAALIRWRMATVTGLVGRIRAELPKTASLHVIPSVQQPLGSCWLEGSDIAGLARAAGGIEACFYGSPAQAVADHAEMRGRAGPEASLRGVLRPGMPDHAGEGSFTAAVRQLMAAGLGDLAFYNYGHMRLANLDWIGRALGERDGRGDGQA